MVYVGKYNILKSSKSSSKDSSWIFGAKFNSPRDDGDVEFTC